MPATLTILKLEDELKEKEARITELLAKSPKDEQDADEIAAEFEELLEFRDSVRFQDMYDNDIASQFGWNWWVDFPKMIHGGSLAYSTVKDVLRRVKNEKMIVELVDDRRQAAKAEGKFDADEGVLAVADLDEDNLPLNNFDGWCRGRFGMSLDNALWHYRERRHRLVEFLMYAAKLKSKVGLSLT